MPLVNYRASAEGFLREIHEVAGHRASAKQTLRRTWPCRPEKFQSKARHPNSGWDSKAIGPELDSAARRAIR